MRIIALMNQKGGVGKTTTTVNLGAALAELGKKVCLIDLDPQSHLTINYGLEPSPDVTSLYDVLVNERSFVDAIHHVQEGTIALVPSSIDLAAAEQDLVSILGRETILKRRIEATTHDFDFILLDCPPSLGLLTLNALAVADEVIIPMQPHFFALQGVAKLLETVQLVSKRINPKLKVSGIALTMYDSNTKLSNEVVAELHSFIDSAQGKQLPWAETVIFKSKIRRNIKLAESPSFGKTIIAYEPTSNGAADYRALAREVLAMSEPLPVEAVVSEPVMSEPVSSEPVLSEPVLSEPVLSEPVMSGPVSSEPVLTELILTEPVLTEPVLSEPVLSEPVMTEPVSSEPVLTEPIPSEPVLAASIAEAPIAEPVEAVVVPMVELTINPDIDPSKLAAANVTLPEESGPIPMPVQRDVEAVA